MIVSTDLFSRIWSNDAHVGLFVQSTFEVKESLTFVETYWVAHYALKASLLMADY